MQIACYLLNNVPFKLVPKFPDELWTGRKITLNHILVWSCPARVLDKELGKLDSCLEVCMFVGYPREINGGYFYNPKENKVLISTNATFLEDSYIHEFKSQSKVVLEDMSNSIVASVIPAVESVPINEEKPIEQKNPKELRHSGRIIRRPNRFMSSGEALKAKAVGHEDDPCTYSETVGDVGANIWKRL